MTLLTPLDTVVPSEVNAMSLCDVAKGHGVSAT
jgi:hypothetical protein